MEKFVDLIKDTNTCGNFLDGKDTNPVIPMWATPLLHSTTAWNNTMHLRFSQKLYRKVPHVVIQRSAPTAIRSTTWSSQGWRLVTHPGFLTMPHHDCCGMCTYVIGNSGAKIWAVMRPKRKLCPDSLESLHEVYTSAADFSEEGTFCNADIVTVCLEEGDVM